MKKFFKALALVLALALVIGVVPAQATSAKIKAKKTLYVDGAKGTSTDGTKTSSYKERVAIYKLAGAKKADKEDHKFTAKIKSGDSVTVSKNYVYAAGLGKSVVELFKDGESLGTTVVTVKKNATADTLTITEFEDGKEVVCGVEYTVTLPRKGVDTDERRLFVDGKAVEDKEDAPRAYAVKFTKAGDYKVKFEAFQGGDLDAATASKEITVKAVMPKAVSAKQVSGNSFAVTFEGSMKDLISEKDITNQMIYYLVADKPVVTGMIKSVVVDEKDPTQVVITMFADFKQSTDYYFAYGNADPVKFTTAKNALTEVDTIVLATENVTTLTYTDLKCKLLNKNGVELSIPTANITYAIKSGNDTAFINGGQIYFTKEGTVDVEATLFIGYDSETFATVTKTVTATVTGTSKAAATVSDTAYSFDGNVSNAVKSIRLGGTGTLAVTYKYSDGDKLDITTAMINGADYKIESTDETVALITASNIITPVAKGSTYIVLYAKVDGNWTVKDAFQLTVDEKQNGAYATAELTKTTWNNHGTIDTAPQLVIKVKNVDGGDYALANCKVTVKQVTNNAAAVGVTLGTAGVVYDDTDAATTTTNLTLTGSPSTSVSTYPYAPVYFTVKVVDTYDKQVLLDTTLSVCVADLDPTNLPANVTPTTKLQLVGSSTLDSSIKKYVDSTATNNSYDDAVISLVEVVSTSYGDFLLDDTVTWDEVVESIPNTTTSGGAAVTNGKFAKTYVIKSFAQNPDATLNETGNVVETADDFTICNFSNASGSTKRAKAGSYVVTGYEVTYDANTGARVGSVKSLGQISVVVTKNDVVPTFVVKSSGSQGKAAFFDENKDDAKLKNVFKVTWDGATTDDTLPRITIDTVTYEYDTVTHAYYVKNFKYNVIVDQFGTPATVFSFTDTLTVNTLFKD